MPSYNPADVERRWQQFWEANKTFRTPDPGDPAVAGKPKYYILDMFPYPSGSGLHVGHPEGYTATDILARYKRMRGCHVLHPMGWDAFGLPAEQHAIATGEHPRSNTLNNINTFRRQIKALGFSYDWDREVDTTDPNYFRWTQWIFLTIYDTWYDAEQKRGRPISELPLPPEAASWSPLHIKNYQDSRRLAYEAYQPVNWCPELGTVLANEEVIDGKSERGGHPVVRLPLRQWLLRITAYADRLLDDLEPLDWSESIKQMQRNWIGKSEGAEVDFKLADHDAVIRVFTTRPDTLFGATYMVLAPEHSLVNRITTPTQKTAVAAYQEAASRKSDFERTEVAKAKTGVFTGAHAINPVNGKLIPVWIADYVLAGYGTGAIMAVPGHDERDFEFAREMNLLVSPVVGAKKTTGGHGFMWGTKVSRYTQNLQAADKTKMTPAELQEHFSKSASAAPIRELTLADGTEIEFSYGVPYTDDGIAINSDFLDGLTTVDAKQRIIAWLEEKGVGVRKVNFKLRDWLFSRQRYWGEPFPVLHGPAGEVVPAAELPVTLPDLADYKPTGSPDGPLAKATDWVNVTRDGKQYRRETNTMPQWAGSCWYYLRYIDPTNATAFADKRKLDHWLPVDLYVGGAEHAVLHLLYARFWHKVLFDHGYVSCPEPFQKLVNQGMILGENGEKMAKSRGNVINPDDVIAEYGADSLRLYEMFMGPLEAVKPWQMNGVTGVYRFLGKVWRLLIDEGEAVKLHPAVTDAEPDKETLRLLHRTIKKVTDDTDGMRFNTAIAAMMEFVNHLTGHPARPRSVLEPFVLLLAPYAPHVAEELWAALGHPTTLAYEPWPAYDPALTKADEIEVPVQVNGKLKARLRVPAEIDDKALEAAALADDAVKAAIGGKAVKKVIVVPRKLVNLVVG